MALLAMYNRREKSIFYSSCSMSAACLDHARQKKLKTFLAGKQKNPYVMAHNKYGNMTPLLVTTESQDEHLKSKQYCLTTTHSSNEKIKLLKKIHRCIIKCFLTKDQLPLQKPERQRNQT